MVINSQRLFDILEIRDKQSKCQVLSEIRHQIKSVGYIAPVALGGGGAGPEGLLGRLLGKNGDSMEARQGLTDRELIKEFRTIGIAANCRYREASMRRDPPIDFATHTESDLDGQSFRGRFPTYLRPISRISRNEFNEKQIANWGLSDTYDHTRRIPKIGRYKGGNRRNDSGRPYQRGGRPNRYRDVNFAVSGEVGGANDSRDYDAEESGNSDYQRCHSHGEASWAENGDNGSSVALTRNSRLTIRASSRSGRISRRVARSRLRIR